jgi:tRNA (guanine-N7-)-methyltransferase
MIVHGDGQRVFRDLLPDNTITAIHVYFPDPWWKKRHRKRRVVNELFLKDVVRTLIPDGRLHFWTDVEEYFNSGIAVITESTPLVGPLPVEERPAEHDLDFRTHFERRMRMAELPVYRSEFRKQSQIGSDR